MLGLGRQFAKLQYLSGDYAASLDYRRSRRCATLPDMQRVLTALLLFTPALGAQEARRIDPLFVNATVAVGVPRRQGPTLVRDESLLARAFDRSRALGQPFTAGLTTGLALDSVRVPQRRGHALLGGLLGLGLGAGAGYLVAIPRVRATERRSDGPLQQIEYVVDPVIGGLVGSIVGGIVGSYVR